MHQILYPQICVKLMTIICSDMCYFVLLMTIICSDRGYMCYFLKAQAVTLYLYLCLCIYLWQVYLGGVSLTWVICMHELSILALKRSLSWGASRRTFEVILSFLITSSLSLYNFSFHPVIDGWIFWPLGGLYFWRKSCFPFLWLFTTFHSNREADYEFSLKSKLN